MRARSGALLIAAGLLLSACASFVSQLVPLPDQSVRLEDHRGARVYLIRETPLPEGVQRMRVYDGARLIGYFGDAGWLCWERPPGRLIVRTITMKEDATTIGAFGSPEVESRIAREAVAGDVAYVGLSVPSVAEHGVLRLIDEEEGRALVEASPPPWVD